MEAEIRQIAAHYISDIPLQDGYELWGTATGSVPYHRKWWIMKGDEVIGHLDQGCYQNSASAAAERREWAMGLGVLGQLIRRNSVSREFESYDPYDVPFVRTAKAVT